MKHSELADTEKVYILGRLAEMPKPSQEEIAEETHHRKAKIGEVLRKFKDMGWEDAKALCDNDQHVLRLREDYVERKIAENKPCEAVVMANITHLRHELGLPQIYYTYDKDGHAGMEF